MKFKQYLNEGNTTSATNMELSIVQSANGDLPKYPEQKEIADNIVSFLSKNNISGKSVHLGSGSYPITQFWKLNGGTDATPKTDLTIGKSRISLKKHGGSQLMSGKAGESKATFYAAVEKTNMQSTEIINDVESYFSSFVDSKDKLNVSQQKKLSNPRKDILNADIMHKQFTKYLSNLFNNDNNFRDAFIYEAMSGMKKFGDSVATASHVLVFDDKNGIDNELHDINDRNFISKKASNTKLSVSWKSTSSTTKKTGKIYSFFSVIRLLNGKVNEEISKYDGCVLNEGIIKSIKDKVMVFFKKLWNKVKQWLSNSINNVIIFFGIEPVVDTGKIYF